MRTEDIQLKNGVRLKYSSAGKWCWNVFQVIDALKDGEYTAYGFSYYCRLSGVTYVHKGNWDSAVDPNRWEKICG